MPSIKTKFYKNKTVNQVKLLSLFPIDTSVHKNMSFEKCSICNKILSDKRSLRRHNQTVHKQYAQNNSFVCDECGFAKTKVLEMENHMRKEHLSVNPRYCLYCNKFFVGDSAYKEHMNKIHGLPVWNADAEKDKEASIRQCTQNLRYSGRIP